MAILHNLLYCHEIPPFFILIFYFPQTYVITNHLIFIQRGIIIFQVDIHSKQRSQIMYQIDFNKPCRVHFIGIGGISMSGLAKLLLDRGFTVSGSDFKKSELTEELESLGLAVSYCQQAQNINNSIDFVVYTAAVHEDNPELAAARTAGIRILTRAELLGQVMTNYKTAVNVAGTHGKTTTSSMIAEILLGAGKDPTVSIGGILDRIKGNFRVGNSDIFLTEACEYTNSFLSFHPTVNVILNVEEDHLDFFKDLNDIRHSFKLFTERLPENGTLIINSDIDNIAYFYRDARCQNVITVGSNPECSMYSACDITYNSLGLCSYTLIKNQEKICTVSLGVPGEHNVYNSLAAIACGELLGISLEDIKEALLAFGGTKRRFEYKGTLMPNHAVIIDDYAHHPAEIAATLNSAANYPHNRIWCIFQPHTYTRTKAFLDDFARVLMKADVVVLADIYAAREVNTLGVSSAQLRDKITEMGGVCHYFQSFEEIQQFVIENAVNNDLLITMGAGNIVEVGENLLSAKI